MGRLQCLDGVLRRVKEARQAARQQHAGGTAGRVQLLLAGQRRALRGQLYSAGLQRGVGLAQPALLQRQCAVGVL